MKNRFWLILMLLLVGCLCDSASAQSPISLATLRPVSDDGIQTLDQQFSMGNQIFNNGIWGNGNSHFGVWNLGGRYRRLEGWLGIRDIDTGIINKTPVITLDGQIVKKLELSSGDKPVHIVLDVTGVKSLRLDVGYSVFADATLYKTAAPVSTTSATQPSGVANLIAPQDGTKVSTSSVSLLWEPVDGATSYGVEIVCTKGGAPGIYALNVTASTARFELTGIANGEYHWSVISFNGSGVMGKFSKDRTFVVAR